MVLDSLIQENSSVPVLVVFLSVMITVNGVFIILCIYYFGLTPQSETKTTSVFTYALMDVEKSLNTELLCCLPVNELGI